MCMARGVRAEPSGCETRSPVTPDKALAQGYDAIKMAGSKPLNKQKPKTEFNTLAQTIGYKPLAIRACSSGPTRLKPNIRAADRTSSASSPPALSSLASRNASRISNMEMATGRKNNHYRSDLETS